QSGDFPDLVPIVQEFLVKANTPIPQKACFAIAGPIVQNTAKLTNLAWFLDTERLEQELGISHVSLINDFAAVGYGILGLEKQDLLTLQVGNCQPEAPIGIIGAG
ncbi:MAG: glucokinase, partial [Nostoc sp.]